MRRSLRQIQQSGSAIKNETDKSEPLSVIKNEEDLQTDIPSRKSRIRKRDVQLQSDEEYVEQDLPAEAPRTKRQKVGPRSRKRNGDHAAQLHARLFGRRNTASNDSITGNSTSINLPTRAHGLHYHRPLLLDSREARTSLLTWFDGVSSAREMPWRKPWADPATATSSPEEVERRAYQVWISEVMLQQTRVATVVDYWNRWMARWPSIRDLAAAERDEVLSAWRGLGYYSRATRIHDAARIVCADPAMHGLLPSDVGELVARVPGVGRYTAGAISAIVFGKAAPMVDGNVLRVLSRQLAVFGDVKADKAVVDLLWAAADSLVKAVARDGPEDEHSAGRDADNTTNTNPDTNTHSTTTTEKVEGDGEAEPSDRPGRWGQALMELGSTICTPKPNCAICPITASCRAYEEGLQLATKRGLVAKSTATSRSAPVDIEDACTLCTPFEDYADEDDNDGDDDGWKRNVKTIEVAQQKSTKSRTQTTLRSFVFSQAVTSKTNKNKTSFGPQTPPSPALSSAAVEAIASHAKKFPLRTAKKAVREEETLVCAVRRSGDGRYLIRKRPEKGLLAGLWELPSCVLEEPQGGASAKARKKGAENFVRELLVFGGKRLGKTGKGEGNGEAVVKYMGELGSVPWVFSHLKLTMHVHLFELESEGGGDEEEEYGGCDGVQSRWSDVEALDAESMGTGMRKCWALVKEAG
ncbi:DNA glycosylase [Daldinia caldariorum]|uniref:DNA glycosylase n=1 Tax=Daldinia caldariorum TaxID=326644 RepID=UPI002007F392|nr:DNA glycosylase [Daldinia caldariorum]KAI1472093.1 DNA glycosylase [Daldinia caldariorum]